MQRASRTEQKRKKKSGTSPGTNIDGDDADQEKSAKHVSGSQIA